MLEIVSAACDSALVRMHMLPLKKIVMHSSHGTVRPKVAVSDKRKCFASTQSSDDGYVSPFAV